PDLLTSRATPAKSRLRPRLGGTRSRLAPGTRASALEIPIPQPSLNSRRSPDTARFASSALRTLKARPSARSTARDAYRLRRFLERGRQRVPRVREIQRHLSTRKARGAAILASGEAGLLDSSDAFARDCPGCHDLRGRTWRPRRFRPRAPSA